MLLIHPINSVALHPSRCFPRKLCNDNFKLHYKLNAIKITHPKQIMPNSANTITLKKWCFVRRLLRPSHRVSYSAVQPAAILVLKFNFNILRLFVKLIVKWRGSLYPRAYFIGHHRLRFRPVGINSLIVKHASAFSYKSIWPGAAAVVFFIIIFIKTSKMINLINTDIYCPNGTLFLTRSSINLWLNLCLNFILF